MQSLNSTRIELEIPIAAPIAAVWKNLVEETDAWWLDDFYMARKPSRITFEAEAGGRVYESGDGGSGLLWYRVIAIEPPHSVHLTGQIAPPYGGPATTFLHLALEARGAETLLKVSDSMLGVCDDESHKCIEEGWGQLFGQGLKRYCE